MSLAVTARIATTNPDRSICRAIMQAPGKSTEL
jgi:hypothetical protein